MSPWAKKGMPLGSPGVLLCFLSVGAPWSRWEIHPLSPLRGCVLRNWEKFDPETLKKKRLIFLCNTAWPQYKLGNKKIWSKNGSINDNTILQLHLLGRRLGKGSECSYVQAFCILSQAPSLYSGSEETSLLQASQ